MATLAPRRRQLIAPDARFFVVAASVMALVLITGFGLHFARGYSSFDAPIAVHLHALVFVSWTGLYLLQTGLAAIGSIALHRRVGWIAAGWLPVMVLMGTYVTVMAIRRGHQPFFFPYGYFLIANPLTVLTFAGLTASAIRMRRQTQWHRRLMLCGMALLTGPGWGRFAPVPLLIPYAGIGILALDLLFPLAGVVYDWRVRGRVHPAWWFGIAAMIGVNVVEQVIPRTPVGAALFEVAMRGSPAAAKNPLDYPPFPPGFPIPHP